MALTLTDVELPFWALTITGSNRAAANERENFMVTERGRFLHSEKGTRHEDCERNQRPFKLDGLRQGESEHMPASATIFVEARSKCQKWRALIHMSNSLTIQPICRFRLRENKRLVGYLGFPFAFSRLAFLLVNARITLYQQVFLMVAFLL